MMQLDLVEILEIVKEVIHQWTDFVKLFFDAFLS